MALGSQTNFQPPITVRAAWDADAQVWYTESSTLPGLNLEADTIDGLRDKLPHAIENLLEGTCQQEIEFELVTSGSVKIPA